MTRKEIIIGVVLIGAASVVGLGFIGFQLNMGTTSKVPAPVAPRSQVEEPHPSLLYGRATVGESATMEGRLRWGRDREAFWSDYFNGVKSENPWLAYVPAEFRPEPVEIFGIAVVTRKGALQPSRPFMARFGDIARIERRGNDVFVTLKSGGVSKLAFTEQTDFDNGLRVWDAKQGVFDLGPRHIRVVDFLPSPGAGAVPNRLHGTVRTKAGDFTGFVEWNRLGSLGSDEIAGRAEDTDRKIRFDTIRSIVRQSADVSLVTLLDGSEIALSEIVGAGDGNLRVYVDDVRYGRVLVRDGVFERIDFTPGGRSPVYVDFPPGRPLAGSVTTGDGRQLTGRLVYDLDESETTDTLDASLQRVDYTIPFALIASIALTDGKDPAVVTLRTGEKLQLDRRGDLSERNGGLLIFREGAPEPEYVIWSNVRRIDFDRPMG